jgi:hypothetical protein
VKLEALVPAQPALHVFMAVVAGIVENDMDL